MVEYSNDPFADLDKEKVDPAASPVRQALSESTIASVSVLPEPDIMDMFPGDTQVDLPGGLVYGTEILETAEVRELTGNDEEALAKAASGSLFRYLNTIIELGLVSVGGYPATPAMRNELLIGDRDTILLGIRKATFGNEIEMPEVICTKCNRLIGDVTIQLDTIPINELEPRDVREFKIPLRKSGTFAVVRLPNGADFMTLGKNDKLSPPEQNTVLLSRCVLSINGQSVNGSTVAVNKLGVSDRKKILKFVDNTQPGPRYDKIEFTHDDSDCGETTSLGINVMDLFREM